MTDKVNEKLEVEFAGVSFGKATARMGIRFARSSLPLASVERLLVGARLRVNIEITDGQPMLPNVQKAKLSSVADCQRVGITMTDYTAGLTFAKAEIDANILCHFANGSGTLEAERIGDAKPATTEEPDDPETDVDPEGEGD